MSFDEWCTRISHFLQGGEGSFKPEAVRNQYALLPAFWHGMEPAEKKLAASILESHAHSFTMLCLRELNSKVHVPFADMQHLRVCLELAAQDPSHLERGVPEKSTSTELCKEVKAARKGLAVVAAGLITFQLHPAKADGSQLFSGNARLEHMIKMARRSVPVTTDLLPSKYLDVEVSPTQQQLLNPKAIDFMMHEIAKHAHGEGAKQVMAKRKLDSLGNVRGDCGFANDPERMKRGSMASRLPLNDLQGVDRREGIEDVSSHGRADREGACGHPETQGEEWRPYADYYRRDVCGGLCELQWCSAQGGQGRARKGPLDTHEGAADHHRPPPGPIPNPIPDPFPISRCF